MPRCTCMSIAFMALLSFPSEARSGDLHNREAAAHAERLAGDVRGRVGGQEEDGVGDVLSRAQAPQGVALRGLLLSLGPAELRGELPHALLAARFLALRAGEGGT